jgi:hypothetical protein
MPDPTGTPSPPLTPEQQQLLDKLRQSRAAYYQARNASIQANDAWMQALDACRAAGFDPTGHPDSDA